MSRDSLRKALGDDDWQPGAGILFVYARDGREAAIAFARQTKVAYRRTILKYGRALTFYPRYLRAYQYAKAICLKGDL